MTGMVPAERIEYSAINDRPKLELPDGARMVFWPVLALEVWDIHRPMARMVLTPPQGKPLEPDIPNWSWHEYGMRVGVWRLIKLFEEFGINPCVTLNARVCEEYPVVAQAILDRGWEFNAHSYDQLAMHKVESQKATIEKSVSVIEKFAGSPPRGWFGPGLTQTFDTMDLLAEAGIEYIGDWVLDDQPVPVKTLHGDVIALPYNYEIHDISQQMIQYHESAIFAKRARDYFDCLYEESAESTKFMSMAVHPFLSGSPHRIKYIRETMEYIMSKPGVIAMDGAQMLDWYLGQRPDLNPVRAAAS
ncbi:MAG: polysaccharide deacetylase family protein [Proteobacteria bacterium]|nr:polysaccharide deacetylase family protein [Pseudomonadota bacterium]